MRSMWNCELGNLSLLLLLTTEPFNILRIVLNILLSCGGGQLIWIWIFTLFIFLIKYIYYGYYNSTIEKTYASFLNFNFNVSLPFIFTLSLPWWIRSVIHNNKPDLVTIKQIYLTILANRSIITNLQTTTVWLEYFILKYSHTFAFVIFVCFNAIFY